MSARNSNVNISTIYSRVMLLSFKKQPIHLIPAKLFHICEARSSQLPCFSFVYFQLPRKITSSINKDFGKCSSQSFSVRRELSEFRTRQFKSFSNSKYLAITFSIYFVKVAE